MSQEQLDEKFREEISLTSEKAETNVFSPVGMSNDETSHNQSCRNELDEKELPNVHQLANETRRFKPFQNISIERDESLSGYRSPPKTCDTMQENRTSSQEFFSPMKNSQNEDEHHTELDESESFRRGIEHEVGEFRDIDLHDSLEDDEDYEEAIISSLKPRKKSYKEKLAQSFLSGLKLLKNKKKTYKYQKSSAANTDNALGSEWELL